MEKLPSSMTIAYSEACDMAYLTFRLKVLAGCATWTFCHMSNKSSALPSTTVTCSWRHVERPRIYARLSPSFTLINIAAAVA
jgi:hypothetical protein